MPTSPEFELIAGLGPFLAATGPDVPLGPGDDAAVVHVAGTPVAFAVDAVVDEVHVTRDICSYADIGWKALAVNVSDLAAVGASTSAAVVALQRPEDVDDAAVYETYKGMREAADRFGVDIVGGDVVSAPVLSLSVAVIGAVHAGGPLRRADAEPGDTVLLIGALGLGAAGLACHRSGAHDVLASHPELLAAYRRPEPVPAAAPALAAAGVHACIDVSDGLGADLGHVARASDVCVRLHADRLPVAAGVAAAARALGRDVEELVIGGGEDLALAVTLPEKRTDALARRLAGAGLPATRIGEVVAGSGVALVTDGEERDVSALGYEHGVGGPR